MNWIRIILLNIQLTIILLSYTNVISGGVGEIFIPVIIWIIIECINGVCALIKKRGII